MNGYKRIFFVGILLEAMGVIFTTALGEKMKTFGIVLIAVGGLLFIMAMAQKRKEEQG